MTGIDYRKLDRFPEPQFAALAREAFHDFDESQRLTEVLRDEASSDAAASSSDASALRIGAFDNDRLVAWTHARADGVHLLMVNSGVTASARRRGIYSKLVQLTIDHAVAHRFVRIASSHATGNNAVIIAKLKLGFTIAGFEYSEVYGPLVRLDYIVGESRRSLHRSRSWPIRQVDDQGGDGGGLP